MNDKDYLILEIKKELISISENIEKLIDRLGFLDKDEPAMAVDIRAPLCRERLRDENKPHPKSGCQACEGDLFNLPI